jgi:tetratricopeptide (TPR) repeat protein
MLVGPDSPNEPGDPWAFYLAAVRALQRKELRRSVTELVSLLEADPESPLALALLRLLLLDGVERVEFLDGLVRAWPAVERPRVCLATAYLSVGRREDALGQIDGALTLEPLDTGALMLKCSVLRSLRRRPEAVAVAQALLEKHRKSFRACRLGVRTLFRYGRFRESWRNAIRVSRENRGAKAKLLPITLPFQVFSLGHLPLIIGLASEISLLTGPRGVAPFSLGQVLIWAAIVTTDEVSNYAAGWYENRVLRGTRRRLRKEFAPVVERLRATFPHEDA